MNAELVLIKLEMFAPPVDAVCGLLSVIFVFTLFKLIGIVFLVGFPASKLKMVAMEAAGEFELEFEGELDAFALTIPNRLALACG